MGVHNVECGEEDGIDYEDHSSCDVVVGGCGGRTELERNKGDRKNSDGGIVTMVVLVTLPGGSWVDVK